MRRKSLSLLFPVLPGICAFLFQGIMRMNSPYLLKSEEVSSYYEYEPSSEYEDLFELSTGTIRDVITIEQVLPEGTYRTETITVRDPEHLFRYSPGDLVKDMHTALSDKDGTAVLLPENARILSVSPAEEQAGGDTLQIRYIPAQKIKADIRIPEEYRNRISSETQITARILGETVDAAILEISDQAAEGSIPVTVLIDDSRETGCSGCKITFRICVEEKQDVLLIPNECLYQDNSGDCYALLCEEQDFFEIPVETGISDEKYTEIQSGLRQGDRVASVAGS